MKVKVTIRGLCRDHETKKLRTFEDSKIIDVPDEKLLHLSGYAATNYLFDRCEDEYNKMFSVYKEYEIAEDGLAKDIPYLEYPFETVKEMREFLSSPDVIAEFEDETEE